MKIVTKKEVEQYLQINGIKNYIIHDDLSVSATGNIYVNQLLIQFREVFGNFCIFNNQANQVYSDVTSLKGCPKKVTGSFTINNSKIISLEGGPEEVGSSYDCSHNQLTSLKYAPKIIGEFFSCTNNELKSLEYAPKYIKTDFNCTSNKIQDLNFFPSFIGGSILLQDNQLINLKNMPKEINGECNVAHNNLISLNGSPQIIQGDFNFMHNEINSLLNMPLFIKGDLLISYNKIQCMKEIVWLLKNVHVENVLEFSEDMFTSFIGNFGGMIKTAEVNNQMQDEISVDFKMIKKLYTKYELKEILDKELIYQQNNKKTVKI